MFKKTDPILCSAFFTDVVILTLEIYDNAGLFFSQIIKFPLIFTNLLLKDAHRMTVCVTFFSERLHQTFVDQVDRKIRGFKYL